MNDTPIRQWQPEDLQGKSALVVFAHPDDVDFHFGGTVAMLVAAGVEVTYLCATRGDKGDRSGEKNASEIALVREEEQHQAARILGATTLEFLDEKDGEVEHTRDLVNAIARKIRAIRPDIVITLDIGFFDPSFGVNHADHRNIATATMDAIYPVARNRNFMPDIPHHVVRTLLVLDYERPNVCVDTSGEAFEKQLLALQCHKSQWGNAERVLNKRRALGMIEKYRLVEFDLPYVATK